MNGIQLGCGENQFVESKIDEVLVQNEISRARWTNFKEEHNALKCRLFSYRDTLKRDIMVPIGKLALVKGKLVHTNEVLVSLGDGWFAKQTAAEAAEICDRRIKYCDEMLDKLEKEKELFTSRKSFPSQYDLFSRDEIVEQYEEEHEELWKEKHRQRVKAYKQEEAKKREETRIKDEKDIFQLLDALEAQEELEDEMYRLEEDDAISEEGSESLSESDSAADEDYESDESGDLLNTHDTNLSGTTIDNALLESDVLSKSRKIGGSSQRVSFADKEDESEPIYIRFKHSDEGTTPIVEQPHEAKEITSPSDIYKVFAQCSLQGPKSILKKTNYVSVDVDKEEASCTLDQIRNSRSEMMMPVKIGDVTERSQVSSSSSQSISRPVSRFKAARQSAKK